MMKKLVLAALAAFTLASTAQAQVVLVQKELGWTVSDASYASGFHRAVLGPRVLAPEAADTSGIFSLQDAALVGPGAYDPQVGASAASDSILVGWVVIYRDSTGDATANLTALTGTIEASGSGDATDWTAVGTTTSIIATGEAILAMPLVLRPIQDHQNLLINAPRLRIRFTTHTGIMQAARIIVRYWSYPRAGM